MKNLFTSRNGKAGLLPTGILAATLLLTPSLSHQCQAGAFDSPVGTWDLISSGAGQNGLAVLTFSNDGTFSGYHFWSPNPPKKAVVDPRGGGGNIGRDPEETSSKTNNFVFGFDDITGRWNYDAKGKVIGFFTILLNVTSTGYGAGTIQTNIDSTAQGGGLTNITVNFQEGVGSLVTNLAWTGYTNSYTIFNTNIVILSAEKTNAVNFTGTVVPGKRVTFVASTAFGKTTYKGLPFLPLLDISGSWIGTKKLLGQTFYEFFDLVPTTEPNIYVSENEIGAGYGFSTVAVISRHKKIGFDVIESAGTNGIHRSTSGTLSVKRQVSAKTKGVTQPLTGVSFDAFLQQAP
ncbi:MAG: hypothetical protein H7X97_07000 [Opitutaceae bacterium]|nr:hypothetical protein [Verrucomicrobiales bacterium]